jgi:hypothetical protein
MALCFTWKPNPIQIQVDWSVTLLLGLESWSVLLLYS